MPMSHFDRASLPPARTVYQREFGQSLGRERRGWAQTKCCFHDGQSKTSLSVNLQEGQFCCFKCGVKGGDVVAFIRLRYKLSFVEAAKELGAWHGQATPEQTETLCRRLAEQECERVERAAKIEAERFERIEAREHLHAVETLYQESIAEHDWYLMSELLPRVRQAEAWYWQLAGLEVRHER
jgi:DNA primase